MGLNSFLAVVFLVCLCQMQGSSAVTPVFVQKGKDVLLNVTTDVLKRITFVSWNFNKKILVSFVPGTNSSVSDGYTGRIEFSEKNFSVKLKNLQKADSGVYTARVFGAEEQTTEYNVTVQDPVSPAGLTVDSVSSSSDSCNLTVTCSAQDSHINSTFTCDHQTCSQEGGVQSEVTTSGASLHVYLVNDSINCNHSNQVSWTNNMTKIQHFCPQHADPDKQELRSNIVSVVVVPIIIIIIIIIFIIFLIVIINFFRKRKKYEREKIENTVYDIPQVTTDRPLDQSPTNDPSYVSPNSTYCLVGHPTGSMGSTETRGKTLPESLYAQVEKPARS
ncbi:CD48 antigen-like isoform X2 [Siniperca chuatsi]|uniref:CD48 antigen-like isoform X2 n=1 Tax=Siniperca chuatsi TaxID=119488 RepID=UPI001CE1B968|nr:CD48 antigen-like isoform X2 [Siniperca chuatsi]